MYFVLLKLGSILNTNQYVFARVVSKQPLERNRRGRRSAREQHRFFPRTFCCVSLNNILQFNLLKSFSKFVFFFTRRFCRRQTGEFLDFSFNRGLHWSLNSQQLRLHRIATLIFKLPSSAAWLQFSQTLYIMNSLSRSLGCCCCWFCSEASKHMFFFDCVVCLLRFFAIHFCVLGYSETTTITRTINLNAYICT